MRGGRLSIVCPSAYMTGGVQTWIDYLVPGLEEAGWRVTLHLPQGRWSDARAYARAHALERNATFFENPTGSREGRVRALAISLRRASPDIVLSVNIADVYEAVNRLRKSGCTTRLAIALHGLHSSAYEELARWAPLVDSAISTNMLGVFAALELSGMPIDKVFYAPCGIEIPSAPPPPIAPKQPLGLVFVGRFDEAEKRISDIPKIARALDRSSVPFSLVLAGSGPDESRLREELREFGSRVNFRGLLKPAQLAREVYQAGSVMILTSPRETGPLVAWEAMAHGVAVVTSAFLGIGREGALVDGRNCLTFPVGDVDAAAKCIARLRDTELLGRLVLEGWQTVSERYTRPASVLAWEFALANALSSAEESATVPGESIPSAGRLDRLLGVHAAETMRRIAGIRHVPSSAGAEWPHSYFAHGVPELDERLRALDARESA